jgi:hypothetical protein
MAVSIFNFDLNFKVSRGSVNGVCVAIVLEITLRSGHRPNLHQK